MPELDHPSSQFFGFSSQTRETGMSDLGLKPIEVRKQPGRLPAEGKLVQKTKVSRGVVFFACFAWPSLYMCHLFGIRKQET
jgi:hypothetical protein